MLDYGFRSKCCHAPIRLGSKQLKNSTKKVKVWVCIKCKKKDVQIIALDEVLEQEEYEPFAPNSFSFKANTASEMIKKEEFKIELVSFGFSIGLIPPANLLIDVRQIEPPPLYLVHKNGTDISVRTAILSSAGYFTDAMYHLILQMIPWYEVENKPLIIAIGCNQGIHRSVSVVESFAKSLRERGHSPIVIHRDLKQGE